LKYYLNFDINFFLCSNLQIMVRTRDLSFASDRVIGRALGREDNHDSDEALQRRRPTTFAHRQKEAVAEDVHHVDDTA